MKKSFIVRKSKWIGLNFFQVKGLCQSGQLERCQKSSKNGQNRDFEPRFKANQSTFDVCRKTLIRSYYHEDILKIISQICSKNLENCKFSFTSVKKRSCDSSLKKLEAGIFFKNQQIEFGNKAKSYTLRIFFTEKKSCNRGGMETHPPPVAINR